MEGREQNPLGRLIDQTVREELAELDRLFGSPIELLLDEKPKPEKKHRRRVDHHSLRVIEGGKK